MDDALLVHACVQGKCGRRVRSNHLLWCTPSRFDFGNAFSLLTRRLCHRRRRRRHTRACAHTHACPNDEPSKHQTRARPRPRDRTTAPDQRRSHGIAVCHRAAGTNSLRFGTATVTAARARRTKRQRSTTQSAAPHASQRGGALGRECGPCPSPRLSACPRVAFCWFVPHQSPSPRCLPVAVLLTMTTTCCTRWGCAPGTGNTGSMCGGHNLCSMHQMK